MAYLQGTTVNGTLTVTSTTTIQSTLNAAIIECGSLNTTFFRYKSIPYTQETWTFTLSTGTSVEKKVLVG